ncbi:SPASM domain-containing protein [bacterium]|nr:SPASM domain-containing protein [candidate division CSSED10-310 bacterium]
MERFTCHWIFEMLVVLCDGKVVCGCADPYGERPLGSTAESSISEIWNSELVQSIRTGLNKGFSPFCRDCGLKTPLSLDDPIPQRAIIQNPVTRIFVEPTILCNISCFQAVCSHESGIVQSRACKRMPAQLFHRIMHETGPSLKRLDFFNYGETFMHPQATDMIAFVKTNYPQIYVYVSTNGIPLTDMNLNKLVESGLDEITFSIDGTTQAIYEKYRRGGNLADVLKNVEQLVRIREHKGSDKPFINWRYILFNWNDRRSQMQHARKLAHRLGVDRLVWEITDHPKSAASHKYQTGTRLWRKRFYEIWDTSRLSNALDGRKYLAKIKQIPRTITCKCGESLQISCHIINTGGATWQHRTSSSIRTIRLGAQLHDSKKVLLNRDYSRAFLPQTLKSGESATVELQFDAPKQPGIYFFKFDMVSEGIDWFESAGSPVSWCRLHVI